MSNYFQYLRKNLFLFSSVAIIFFALGVSKEALTPYLKSKATIALNQFNKENKNINLNVEDFSLSLFPMGLSLKEVTIQGKNETKKYLKQITAEKIKIAIDFFALYEGKLSLKSLNIEKGKGIIQFNSKDLFKKSSSSSFNLKSLLNLPLRSLSVQNFDLQLNDTEKKLSSRIKNLSINVDKVYSSLAILVKSKQLYLKDYQNNQLHHGSLEIDSKLSQERLRLESFKLNYGKSFIVAFGTIKNPFESEKLALEVQSRVKLFFPTFQSAFSKILYSLGVTNKNFTSPHILGHFQSDITLSTQGNNIQALDLILKTKELSVNKNVIGDAFIEGKLNKNLLHFKNFKIKNSSGSLNANSSSLEIKAPYKVKLKTKLSDLNLQQFLRNIKLKKVPVFLTLNSMSECLGTLSPLKVHCSENHAKFKNIKVKASVKDKENIVDLGSAMAKGNFTLTENQITYESLIIAGESFGSSDGKIHFDKGFNINFDGEIDEFKKFTHIAGLVIEGGASLQGSTKGNSNTATVNINAIGKNTWFEDYFMGSPSFNLKYKRGDLLFTNVKGVIENSKYFGNMTINIPKKTIFAKIQSPYFTLEEGSQVFKRKVQLPFSIEGPGNLDLIAKGPLNFSKLSYEFNANTYKTKIWQETFDTGAFKVISKNGFVQTTDAFLKKGSGQIDLIAKAEPSAQLNAEFIAENFRTEQSDFLNKIGLKSNGNINFKGKMQGHILKPKVTINGTVTELIAQDKPLPDSYFQILVDHSDFIISTNFFSSQLKLLYSFPFRNKNSKYRLNALASQLNVQNFFYLFPYFSLASKYKILTDANFQWESNDGLLYNSSGSATIPNFEVLYNGDSIKNNKVIDLTFSPKFILLKPVSISGDGTFLNITSQSKNFKNLDLKIDGKVDLSFFHLLTPFFSEISGINTFSINITGDALSPKITGSSYIRNGICQLKSLIHPFTGIHSDLLFSENSLLINSVRGRFGKGPFLASGNISFKGTTKIPVAINGSYHNAQLNIPHGFKTTSEGRFFIKGDWFPYTLGGKSNILKADVQRNFDQKPPESTTVLASEYLPEFIKIQEFEPVELDMNINLVNPANVNVVVNSARIKTQVFGAAKITKYPHSPIISGQFIIKDGGEVSFQSNDFEIISGRMDYFNAPPHAPEIFATAQSRITSMTNEEYDINLLLQGSPQEPRLKINSQPPLEEHELISLLALGITTTEAENNLNSEEHAAQTSLQLTSKFLKSQLGLNDDIEQKLGFEFEIASDIIEDDQPSIPKVVIKKQIKKDLLFSASRTLETNPKDRLSLEYKMNKNFSVIGSFKKESGTETIEDSNEIESDILGLDLEYKVEFK